MVTKLPNVGGPEDTKRSMKSRKAPEVIKEPVVVVEEPKVPIDQEVEELKKQGWRTVIRCEDGSIDCR